MLQPDVKVSCETIAGNYGFPAKVNFHAKLEVKVSSKTPAGKPDFLVKPLAPLAQPNSETTSEILTWNDTFQAKDNFPATGKETQSIPHRDTLAGILNLPEKPTSPSDSYTVTKEEEKDWIFKNASFLHRNESTKGSSSRRLKHKLTVIGLPETQNSGYLSCKFRPNVRPKQPLFIPKRTASPLREPSSPKVSCLGSIKLRRSQKQRRRTVKEAVPPPSPTRKPGFWSRVKRLIRFSRRKKDSSQIPAVVGHFPAQEGEIPAIVCQIPASSPPRLSELKRFVSGRKAASMGVLDFEMAKYAERLEDFGEMEVSDRKENIGEIGLSERKKYSGEIWRRRLRTAPPTLVAPYDGAWKDSGPASI
ncbi:uncharacterized protein LOC18444835 [Amborella trichopoda]|uniref:Uncharacterized protein n=1 Tax=Amborella trichopoda TaxID=13333 RepID=U5D545_AMBTC|nr:uncharacterized protein LOC18444835 [Amborella trichopoda]ERN16522.1 hypothetical protein AMTR_s00031p00101560 [Amborella trichopoda]|eukprot:XP_006855055.1 uncharacterized protein LOC18444835 [Amborella trichopoda]